LPAETRERTSATSTCYQGAVFSPLPGRPPTFAFDPQLELLGPNGLTERLIRAGQAVYANIGAANNPQFAPGYIHFNERYAQEVRRFPSVRAQKLVADGRLRVVPRQDRFRYTEFIYLYPSFGSPEIKDLPRFVHDVTHPDVVRLCMAHVRDFAVRHARMKGLFLRGESGGATFGPHSLVGFRRYMADLLGAGNAHLLAARWQLLKACRRTRRSM
jgi:hypothetical protein